MYICAFRFLAAIYDLTCNDLAIAAFISLYPIAFFSYISGIGSCDCSGPFISSNDESE